MLLLHQGSQNKQMPTITAQALSIALPQGCTQSSPWCCCAGSLQGRQKVGAAG